MGGWIIIRMCLTQTKTQSRDHDGGLAGDVRMGVTLTISSLLPSLPVSSLSSLALTGLLHSDLRLLTWIQGQSSTARCQNVIVWDRTNLK